SLRACTAGVMERSWRKALLRIPHVDHLGKLANPLMLLSDPRLQLLGRAAEDNVTARLQFPPGIGLLTDRRDVRGDAIPQCFGHGLATEDSGHAIDFEFGVTEFAH